MAPEVALRRVKRNARGWNRSDRRTRAAIGLGHVALILGVVALVLGGTGLAIALTNGGHTGSAGAPGATGGTGPAGPGAVVNHTYFDSGQLLTAGCAFYSGANISLTAAGPGTFVVTASIELFITHTYANYSSYAVGLANASASCSFLIGSYATGYMSSVAPSDGYYADYALGENFAAGAAGTYTFGIIGSVSSGVDPIEFYWSSVSVEFYPA